MQIYKIGSKFKKAYTRKRFRINHLYTQDFQLFRGPSLKNIDKLFILIAPFKNYFTMNNFNDYFLGGIFITFDCL